ncbi:hypothetical protein [Bacillus paralicheniformis]|uniref:hypothetical protein n=1 Tax=Bacillus paralicheniformis TaxID=1648923 RepID=UPI003BF96458
MNIAGDTTFALSLEAQKRGHELYHYTPDRLSMRDGGTAHGRGSEADEAAARGAE